jgi:murein L,D-transpeptidase YafK
MAGGFFVSLSLIGCGLFGPSTPPTIVPAAAPLPEDADALPWAESERLFLVVRKGCKTLDVYEYGRRIASFAVVLGRGGPGRKLYEGDRKTPSGLYSIVGGHRHARWQHFFLLDYPNVADRERHAEARAAGEIPPRGGGYPGPGGLVGIHGTDKPDMNQRHFDWTFGCVSLQRDDIHKLARLVSPGTLVLIQD